MPSHSIAPVIAVAGSVMAAATSVLAVTRAPLGSAVFFATAGVAAAAYLVALARVRAVREAAPRLLLVAFGLAVAMRAPLVMVPVDRQNDMVRYLWDGRVQRLGYNPYLVVPSDPAMARTHTDETRQMPSRNARTPYPPAAQLFFRAVSSLHESTLAMKLALLACDLLTIVILWRWLAVTGRNEWLTLVYAWNPLVVLEVAHGGHVDALGAMWIVASAYWLARRRTMPAAIAFALAIASKLVPIVLVPLLWRRIRVRDAAAGLGVLAAVYLPFMTGRDLPVGAVPNVIAHIRFNGPIFHVVSGLLGPPAAAAAALIIGLVSAAWARLRLTPDEPASWAWPMALSLASAPVVYPWYLLYITPFLFSVLSLPLVAWTLAVVPVYAVWAASRHGAPWAVPVWVEALEYGVLAVCVIVFAIRLRPRASSPQDELN